MCLRCSITKFAFPFVISIGIAVSVQGQSSGIRENSYKPITPFADVGRHTRDTSPLGAIDGGVNQSIDLGAAVQFDGAQSRTAGLDQLQPSPRAGALRSALAGSRAFGGDAGALRLLSSQPATRAGYFQPYLRPSYLLNARKRDTVGDPLRGTGNGRGPSQGTATLLARSQAGRIRSGASLTGSVAAVEHSRRNPKNTPRKMSGFGVSAQMGTSGTEQTKRGEDADSPSGTQNAMQSPFERIGDPFRSASATGFDGFGARSTFDRACGDACGFRSRGGIDAFGDESRQRRRAGEMPEDRVPDARVPDKTTPLGQDSKIP